MDFILFFAREHRFIRTEYLKCQLERALSVKLKLWLTETSKSTKETHLRRKEKDIAMINVETFCKRARCIASKIVFIKSQTKAKIVKYGLFRYQKRVYVFKLFRKVRVKFRTDGKLNTTSQTIIKFWKNERVLSSNKKDI